MALWQQQPSGDWRLLQCGSHHVTAAESRYFATEVELLAVVWATQKAHLYLAGSDFELLRKLALVGIIPNQISSLSAPTATRIRKTLGLIPGGAALCFFV